MALPTDERLAELTEKLENGIQELYASGRYGAYLSAMSKFFCNAQPPAGSLAFTPGKRNLAVKSNGAKKAFRFWPHALCGSMFGRKQKIHRPDGLSIIQTER